MSAPAIGKDYTGMEIAVIGMAARFPYARNVTEFWENLKNGRECITFFSEEELREKGISEGMLERKDYVRAKGVLENKDGYDAGFFDHTPVEAEMMDPQTRIFMECVWHALEDAGHTPYDYSGSIGLFAGSGSSFGWEALSMLSGKSNAFGEYAASMLLNRDYMCTRISYDLDLRGPSYSVQTACSTSLVAVHMASRALLTGDCTMALAGGVCVSYVDQGYLYQEGMINSPDGHCRTFDAKANGTLFGDGAGVVLLKRLKEALKDGDHIYAVIRGSAVNNDGKRKVGFTAPSVDGQAEVIRKALRTAGVEPESIAYVEAHGTGTPLGDPVEIEGLKTAFRSEKREFCGIGSIKTNLGHTDTAAGIAGFIKAVLALQDKAMPPSLNFESCNPNIDLKNSPFYVNTELKEWQNGEFPRRAGVSSFGIGGTNAHIILEEPPEIAVEASRHGHHLLLLSARSESSLEEMTANLVSFLSQNPTEALADIAWTLQTGRQDESLRRFLLCETSAQFDSDDLAGKHHMRTQQAKSIERPIVFTFPGQGAQYLGMGAGLCESYVVFAEKLKRYCQIYHQFFGFDLGRVFQTPGSANLPAEFDINRTEFTQPAIFIFSLALAKFLIELGLKPRAMVGHSIGEYVAACLAGVFSEDEAIRLVGRRGKLMQQLPAGDMLSVAASEAEVAPFLTDHIDLAAVNSSESCVLSGTKAAVGELHERLQAEGFTSSLLHTSHAFHSTMMEPILSEFEREVSLVEPKAPAIEYLSNLTGEWVDAEQVTNPKYWSEHLRRAVRFHDNLSHVFEIQDAILLEVGPGRALSTFARQHESKQEHAIVDLIKHPKSDVSESRHFLGKLGEIWLSGGQIDWTSIYIGEKRLRVPLPGYAFERKRYWIDAPIDFSQLYQDDRFARKELDEWGYVPTWKRKARIRPESDVDVDGNILLIADSGRIARNLSKALKDLGNEEIRLVQSGEEFSQDDDGYALAPSNPGDWVRLFTDLSKHNWTPDVIFYLASMDGKDGDDSIAQATFFNLLHLANGLSKSSLREEILLKIVTDRHLLINGNEQIIPAKALSIGPFRTIPQEVANLSCDCIDIDSNEDSELVVMQLLNDLRFTGGGSLVGYRGQFRWQQTYEAVPFDSEAKPQIALRERGVYLITGGLGGISLTIAQHLANTRKARLVLMGRSDLPEREQWDDWLATHTENDATAKRMLKLREIENSGGEALYLKCDVTDLEQATGAVAQAELQFGKINGVIHAAGLPDGRALQLRTPEFTQAVLAPKVRGTEVLEKIFEGKHLDFMLLCSSLNALSSIFGQVSYCAANAFQDAFAQARSLEGAYPVLSVNWDRWEEVGMAAESQGPMTALSGSTTHHLKYDGYPLFDEYVENGSALRVFQSRIHEQSSWILDQHRIIAGHATMPGTGYLDIIYAALASDAENRILEISNLVFLSPLVIGLDGSEQRDFRAQLDTSQTDTMDVAIMSRVDADHEYELHAQAQARLVARKGPVELDVSVIAERCRVRVVELGGVSFGDGGAFGPRWNSAEWLKLGNNEALAKLRLPDEFLDDLKTFHLHPALMDLATGLLMMLRSFDGDYLPFSYKQIRVHEPLKQEIYSHFSWQIDSDKRDQHISLNIKILDNDGRQLVEIEDYVFRRIDGAAINDSDPASLTAPSPPRSNNGHGGMGIRPAEGIQVFEQTLKLGLPQLIVSTTDLEARLSPPTIEELAGELGGPDDTPLAQHHTRPTLSVDYLAPRNPLEQELAEIWQGFFGFERIGVHDDFFELGGDSLRVMVMISRIHKKTQVEVSLTDFFESPTIAELAQVIANAEKSSFLEIKPAPAKDSYELSAAQKRLHFLSQTVPDSAVYNITEVYRVSGDLDYGKLEQAFAELIARHESLRTAIEVIDGRPVQRIYDEVAFAVEYFEMNEDEAAEFTDGFRKPFDLNKPPALRVGVIRLSEQEHILLYDLSHIIADGTSLIILMQEFHALYLGQELPDLNLQYRDFSEWQVKLFQSERIAKQEDFWLSEFAGELPQLSLPTDRQRPAFLEYAGDSTELQIRSDIAARARQLSADSDTTMFMLMFAVYNVLLGRLTGQEDIIVGVPTTGRHHADLANIIGMFINTIALRTRPAGNKTFSEFLREVKETTLNVFANQDYQFEMLVDRLELKPDPSRTPLFDTLFNFRNMFVEETASAETDLRFEPYQFKDHITKFDLDISLYELDSGFYLNCSYRTSLFNRSTVDYILNEYRDLLDQVTQNPDRLIRDYEILQRKSTAQRRQRVGLAELRNG